MIMKGKLQKFIIMSMVLTLLVSLIPSSVFASTNNLIKEDSLEELLSEDGDFIKFMEGIEELPSGIEKQGAEKVANWLTKKTGVEVIAEGENLLVPSLSELDVEIPEQAFNSDLITTFGVTDCIIAVGLMIGTVGFPLSKITKLKKAIDFLGGVNKTVNRIYKSYKKYKSWNYRTKDAWKAAVNESAKGLPQDTLNAFLDFFNISNVVNNCT